MREKPCFAVNWGWCAAAWSPRVIAEMKLLFDPGVTLLPSGDGLHDPLSGNNIPFGQRISGGGGVSRESGRGWPISDIERFYGVTIPAAYRKDYVMRLRNMEVLNG